MQDMQKIKKIELQHKKLLAEYNAILVALATFTIGLGGLIYTLTKDIFLSLTSLIMIYLILNNEKDRKSQELNNKINEI